MRKRSSHITPPLSCQKKNDGHPPLPRTPHFKKTTTLAVNNRSDGRRWGSSADRRRSQKWASAVGSLHLCDWYGVGEERRGKQRYIERGREDRSKRERSGWPFFAEHIDTPFVSLAHSNLHTQYAAAVW